MSDNQKKDDAGSSAERKLVVGYYKKRLVVFGAVPFDAELVDVFFAHGGVCFSAPKSVVSEVVLNASPVSTEKALALYSLWESRGSVREASLPAPSGLPALQKMCPLCDGQGVWMDRVNKCSYGVMHEDDNVVDRCPKCNGHGFVDNFEDTP